MRPVFRGTLALIVALVIFTTAVAVAPPPLDAARVAALVKKLDADAFRTRQKADDALRALGRPALPFIRGELARARSFEVCHRLRLIEQHLTADDNVAELVKLLGHSDKKLHQHAGQALRNGGTSALPALRRELDKDLSPEQRKRLKKVIDDVSAARR
jgi:hypothetical protein